MICHLLVINRVVNFNTITSYKMHLKSIFSNIYNFHNIFLFYLIFKKDENQ